MRNSRRHRVEQAKMKLALGKGYRDQGLVFPDPFGDPWDPDQLSSTFYYYTRKANIAVSFHGLRHSNLQDHQRNYRADGCTR